MSGFSTPTPMLDFSEPLKGILTLDLPQPNQRPSVNVVITPQAQPGQPPSPAQTDQQSTSTPSVVLNPVNPPSAPTKPAQSSRASSKTTAGSRSTAPFNVPLPQPSPNAPATQAPQSVQAAPAAQQSLTPAQRFNQARTSIQNAARAAFADALQTLQPRIESGEISPSAARQAAVIAARRARINAVSQVLNSENPPPLPQPDARVIIPQEPTPDFAAAAQFGDAFRRASFAASLPPSSNLNPTDIFNASGPVPPANASTFNPEVFNRLFPTAQALNQAAAQPPVGPPIPQPAQP